MSYFDYFSNVTTHTKRGNNEAIQGKCTTMCPQEEIELRINNTLVHKLELIETTRKMVKSYSRSAADSKMAVSQLLRPYPVLKETVEYLIFEVTKRTDVPLAVVYDFVDDRLRAVRQDMTIQRLPPEQCVTLLEPMVRFYVYFGYRLCEYPIKDYAPVLNKKYLLECLKLFLSCSDATDTAHKNTNIQELGQFLSNLEIKTNDKPKIKCDRTLMEGLYIICNLDSLHPLFRYLQLPKTLKSKHLLQVAYGIAVANIRGNYMKVIKLSRQLCPLTYCALCLYLPIVQKKALQVMSHAYNSKQVSMPCQVIREWLMFNSDAEALIFCKYYGLKLQGDKVYFSKADFKTEAVLPPKKILVNDTNVNVSSEKMFTYDSESFT